MRLVERRIGVLFALFLVLLAMAGLRAVWLGTVRGAGLKQRAVSQQLQDVAVPGHRGTITDRNGLELAVTEDSVTVTANPRLISRPASAAAQLAPLLGRTPDQLAGLLADRSRGFAYLARKLPLDQGNAIAKLKITGIDTVDEPRRVYPQGALAAQVIGAVGTDNYGLSGIEQSRERVLHGRDGRRRVVRDALGQPISIVDQQRSQPGQGVQLTIDAAIQQRVESVLAGVGQAYSPRGASALVMDPRNGEILAIANWPPVDPQRPGAAPPFASQDRAVGSSYEPGSTFKAITVAGALENRLIDPHTVFDLPPEIRVADRTIREAHPRGTETLSVGQILAQSSNVGAVTIGLRLGPQRFDSWVRRFGFGASTSVDLPGEAAGIVPRPAHYSGSTLGNLPIGQGLAVTPMQMAAAYEAIAAGGVVHRPHAILSDPAPSHRVISAQTAGAVAQMLEGVLGPGGTAPEASVPGYTLAGKTGTAEKPDPLTGGYSKTKYVASFIGFAPARNPRLLVSVMVDEPQGQIYGGLVAGPAFSKIASYALSSLRIPPA
ncbi:MAG: penicillin-binding protein [Thermoleophilaceae bacterium]